MTENVTRSSCSEHAVGSEAVVDREPVRATRLGNAATLLIAKARLTGVQQLEEGSIPLAHKKWGLTEGFPLIDGGDQVINLVG